MSRFYFAYGSNMNSERMRARQMRFGRLLAGRLHGVELAFNKRAADLPGRAYANLVFARQGTVEGVLYELESEREMLRMDPFEGTPRYYSRDIYPVQTGEGEIPAWVYVANRAMIDDNLRPERWYVDHLLAGRPYLSDGYVRRLLATPCHDSTALRA